MAKDINSTILKKTLQKLVPLFAEKVDTSAIGAANGIAALDNNGKIVSSALPHIAMTDAEGNALFDSVFKYYEIPQEGE